MEKLNGNPKCQWEDNVEMNRTNRLQRCELDWLIGCRDVNWTG